MNTTYDTDFRFKALLTGVGDTLHQWRRTEPTLGVIANAVKSWQTDWSTLNGIMQHQNRRMSVKSHNVNMSLEEAWENRDNRRLAIKAVEDAYEAMKSVGKTDAQDTFVPLYRKRAVKAAFGDAATMPKYGDLPQQPTPVRVKTWVTGLRNHLADVQEVPQRDRQNIAVSPQTEGHVYTRNAIRAKSWMEQSYPSIEDKITPSSEVAIKAIFEKLNSVERMGRVGLLDQGARRAIHSQLRSAFKMIEDIEPEMRTPTVKADLFQDVDTLRGRIDSLMPLVEHGKYDESDLYRDVTEAIESNRSIATAAPIKYMPHDTWDNFNNLDRSLTQVLVNRNPAIRVKALRAAAANLDIITSDLAELEGSNLRPNGQIVGVKSGVRGRRHMSPAGFRGARKFHTPIY